MRPGNIAIFAGGIVLLLSSFLDWFFNVSAWKSSVFGLTGLFLLVLSAACIALGAIRLFAPQVKLPRDILGFTPVQVVMVFGWATFVLAFSLLFRDESAKIGTILAVLSSAAVVAGAFMEDKDAGVPSSYGSPSSGPATPF
jgi:hypothetical protein